jgi:hypothetical protein
MPTQWLGRLRGSQTKAPPALVSKLEIQYDYFAFSGADPSEELFDRRAPRVYPLRHRLSEYFSVLLQILQAGSLATAKIVPLSVYQWRNCSQEDRGNPERTEARRNISRHSLVPTTGSVTFGKVTLLSHKERHISRMPFSHRSPMSTGEAGLILELKPAATTVPTPLIRYSSASACRPPAGLLLGWIGKP